MIFSFSDIDSNVYLYIFNGILLVVGKYFVQYSHKYFYGTIYSIESSKNKNQSKKLWIKLLRENTQIDNYLLKFKQIEKNENLKGSNSSPLVVGLIFSTLYVFLLLILEKLGFTFWSSMSYMALAINIVSLVTTTSIMRYMYLKLRTPGHVYDKATFIVNGIDVIKFYMLLSNGVHLFTILLLHNKNQIPFPDLDVSVIILFEMSFALAVASYYEIRLARGDFLNLIKNAINVKILNECPMISITTNERELKGKIKDIFDEEIIVLDDNGYKSMAKWVDIIGIYLH